MSTYTINDLSYVSATTITGLLGGGDALVQWAVNESFKQNNKQGWKKMRNETCDIGHEFHSLVEIYINIKIKGNIPDLNVLFPKEIDINLRQMFYQFLVWEKYNVKFFILSESQVVNEKFCYAGTFDFIYINMNDDVCLVDIKTKNEIYPDVKMQLSAYKHAIESMTEKKYIIHCERNGNEWDKSLVHSIIKIDKIQCLKIARDFFDLQLYDYTNDEKYAWSAFCGLLQFYYNFKKRRANNRRAKERR